MGKAEKYIRKLFDELDIREESRRTPGHIFIKARHVPTGRKLTITFPYSPSDYRAWKNKRAELRRMISAFSDD